MRRNAVKNKKSSSFGNFIGVAGERLKEADFTLLTVTLCLMCYGIIMVFSASYYSSIDSNGTPFFYLFRTVMWAVVGTCAMILGMLIDYRKYSNKRFVYGVLALSFVLLILVLIPGLGENINDSTRWIPIGPVTIMPGEIAKAGIILFTAWYYGRSKRILKSPVRGIFVVLAVAGAMAILIMKQPNLSTALTICMIAVFMMYVAGMKFRNLVIIGVMGIASATLYIFLKGGYQMERLIAFMDPYKYEATSGYQIIQGLNALGSGGFLGVGLGRSISKSNYLPFAHNDYILAIIGEETGYIGIIVLLILYVLFIWRGAKAALKAKDEFGMLLASGVVLMVGIQVIMNVAIVTASMPSTGVALPFVSYGGNALLIMMFLSGVLLNISRSIPEEDKDERMDSK